MRKIYKIYFFFVIILIVTFCIISIYDFKSNIEIDYIVDELNYQHSLEQYFTSYDYTPDNMNIIPDPYKISPLTALIMFTTYDSEKIRITIKGKSNNDFVYNYNDSYNHSIIIYGLYADYNNEVIVEGESFSKTIYIKTKALPNDFKIRDDVIVESNNFSFISDNYLYAIDNNKDVRWFLNNSNIGNISITKDNHLIIGTNRKLDNNFYTGVQEINLLGKIYYEYYVDYGGLNKVDNNYIYVDNYLISRQTGEVEKNKNKIDISNRTFLSGNNTNENFSRGIRFGKCKITNMSKDNVLLLKYKKLPKKYKIKIYKEFDRLVVEGKFDTKSYLVLDKLFDKRIYNLNNDINYVNSVNLHGKYNIYIKINNELYKTDKYVRF